MTALIRSELVQLRTLRSTYGVAAALVVLVVAVTWGGVSDAKVVVSAADFTAPALVGAGMITAFFGALLAATRVASEYRYGTIANRALAAPRRGTLLATKLVTFGALAALVSLVTVAVALGTAAPVFDSKGMSMALGAADVFDLTTRVVVAGTLFTMLGVSVGFIARSQQAAVVAVFGTFLAEKLLSGVLGPVSDYLPFGLLSRMLDNAASNTLVAGLVLAAVTAATATVAGVLLRRRDLG